MKKYIILISTCFFLLFFTACTNIYSKDTLKFKYATNHPFEDVILKKYAKDNFNELIIERKINAKDYEFATIENNSETIDKVLQYLKSFNLKEVDCRTIPKTAASSNYNLLFYNNSTYENLYFEILNDEYVEIRLHLIKKETDIKKNSVTYNPDRKYAYYKLDKKIDLKLIDDIFNSFKTIN